MEKIGPWAALLEMIEPHYPKTGRRGRPPMPLAMMLRIYFMCARHGRTLGGESPPVS
jgi:hypothetical protein